MRLDIVTIGNSQGVRLPKFLLSQCGFDKTVEVEVRGEELIFKKLDHPRAGWREAFAAASQHRYTDLDHDWLDACSEKSEEDWQW